MRTADMEPRGGNLSTTGREIGKASIGMIMKDKRIPKGLEELTFSRAVSEIALEDKVGNSFMSNMCNLLQDIELDLWPEEESENSKYEVTDWQESRAIGAVLIKETEDRGKQAGPSLREDGSRDRPNFLGIIKKEECSDCEGSDFGRSEQATPRQGSRARRREGIPLRELHRPPTRRRHLDPQRLLDKLHRDGAARVDDYRAGCDQEGEKGGGRESVGGQAEIVAGAIGQKRFEACAMSGENFEAADNAATGIQGAPVNLGCDFDRERIPLSAAGFERGCRSVDPSLCTRSCIDSARAYFCSCLTLNEYR